MICIWHEIKYFVLTLFGRPTECMKPFKPCPPDCCGHSIATMTRILIVAALLTIVAVSLYRAVREFVDARQAEHRRIDVRLDALERKTNQGEWVIPSRGKANE